MCSSSIPLSYVQAYTYAMRATRLTAAGYHTPFGRRAPTHALYEGSAPQLGQELAATGGQCTLAQLPLPKAFSQKRPLNRKNRMPTWSAGQTSNNSTISHVPRASPDLRGTRGPLPPRKEEQRSQNRPRKEHKNENKYHKIGRRWPSRGTTRAASRMYLAPY